MNEPTGCHGDRSSIEEPSGCSRPGARQEPANQAELPSSAVIAENEPKSRPLTRKSSTRRDLNWLRLRFVPIGLVFFLVLLLALIGSYVWPGKQSYAIEAETRAVELVVDGSDLSTWRLEKATLCVRRRDRNAPEGIEHPNCSREAYDVRRLDTAEFRWPDGAHILMRWSRSGGVEIAINDPGDASFGLGVSGLRITAGSRILIDGKNWPSHPVFPFSSTTLVLGHLPTTGEEGILQSGRYQVKETLPGRSSAVTVEEGQFYPGDRISFEEITPWLGEVWQKGNTREAPNPLRQAAGFVTASPNGLMIVAYTPLQHRRMRIDRLGAEPSFVEVRWTSRAIRDPLLVALTALTGVFGLVFPFGAIRLKRLQGIGGFRGRLR